MGVRVGLGSGVSVAVGAKVGGGVVDMDMLVGGDREDSRTLVTVTTVAPDAGEHAARHTAVTSIDSHFRKHPTA